MASTLSSSTFLLNFWFLPVFVVFLVVRVIAFSYGLSMHKKLSSLPSEAKLGAFFENLLKAFEQNDFYVFKKHFRKSFLNINQT